MGNPGDLGAFFGSTSGGVPLPSFVYSPIRFAEVERKQSFDNGYAYLKWPMSLQVSDLAICKGSQMGFTSMCINIVIVALVGKTPTLYLLPTESAIQDFSAARFNSIIRDSILSSVAGTDNVGLKTITGTPLYLRGARSESKLKEIPVQLLIVDECDSMSVNAIALALERLTGGADPRVIFLSTPRLADTGIYKETGLRDLYMYFVRCLRCGRHQALELSHLDLDQRSFKCEKCKSLWSDAEKVEMVRKGAWYKVHTGNGKIGIRINQLYSPTVYGSNLVDSYLEAQGNESKLQVFYNSKLGLPYEAKGTRISQAVIDSVLGECPSKDGIRVCGIDVSQASPHYCVFARVFSYGVYIDECRRATWEELPRLLKARGVKLAVIDSRPETHSARLLAAQIGNLWLAQYVSTQDVYKEDPTKGLVNINRTQAIDAIVARFNNGTIMIHPSCPDLSVLREHINNTVRGYRVNKGGPEAYYYEIGEDHYLHALVYTEIAAMLSNKETSWDMIVSDKLF